MKCFEYVASSVDISLILYHVTTLYFGAEEVDDLRKVGYSKERRVDPQIVVGLLVDRAGFPLEIGCFAGNHAETTTILPIVHQFPGRHRLADMVVVADAGMLSVMNLRDLANRFRWHGGAFTDGQVIDTITPRHGNSMTPGLWRQAAPVARSGSRRHAGDPTTTARWTMASTPVTRLP